MVCKYFTTREKKIAIALMVDKLGLQDKLPTKQDEETVIVDDQPNSSPPIALSGEPEVTVEDDSILGDIFHSPDCPPPPPTLASAIAGPIFTRTVLSMKGLVGMLKQCQTIQDKLGILDNGDQGGEGDHPVYVIFSFISQELIPSVEMEDSSFTWMKDAVGTTKELINMSIEHQFIANSMDISMAFLRHSLSSLMEMTEAMKYRMVVIISLMGANKMLGKQVVTFLLQMFTETADRLREAMVYRYEDNTMYTFTVYINLMLEVWPFFVGEVCPVGGKGGGRKKERSVKPRLSLGETTELAEEVACWRELLDQCTMGLTVLQPDFCEAIWRVDQFCQGMVHSLTRP